MPDLNISTANLSFCIVGGIIFLMVILFALGRPKNSFWIEKCPYCKAELGSKFKGERLTACRKCGHDLYTTKPHSS